MDSKTVVEPVAHDGNWPYDPKNISKITDSDIDGKLIYCSIHEFSKINENSVTF